MSALTRLSLALAGFASLAAPILYGLISAAAVAAPVAAQSSAPTAAEIAHREYEQSRPQKEVPFNPADFHKFAGYYRLGDTDNFAHVYRTGNRYYSQLTGQPAVEIFPESPTEFFMTAVAAQVSFVVGADGRVTGMVIHQGGGLHPLHRVSKAQFEAGSASLARRIKDNVPSPGTRALVLKYIKDLEQERPQDYETMAPELAAIARSQYPQASALVRRQGPFESLAFARVAPNGYNLYVATFARGKLLWVISPLSKDGKVTGLLVRPFPP